MDQAESPAEAPEDALGIDKRSKRAFTVSLVVVLVVIVVALAYSVVRDPGPQPTIPPKITGTDDGALKRAIVHYLGALESRDVDEMTVILDDDSARGRAQARIAIDDFGVAAAKKAEVSVAPDSSESGSTESREVTIRFADDSEQIVYFNRANERGEPWWANPITDQDLPEPDPIPVEPGSPPTVSVSPDELS